MKALVFTLGIMIFVCATHAADAASRSGMNGGIIVHLDSGNGEATAKLASGGKFLVHGLDTDAADVAKARKYLRSKGLYGDVSVAVYDGKSLPYGDNVVNLLMADNLGDISKSEALRVLVPGGAMVIDGKKTVKPWPKNIDDWPQYLNKADNNAVAMDSVVGPPRRLQWMDKPIWARSHMAISTTVALVTGGGRLFSIEDTAPTANPYLPAAFKIVARDAFNGRTLWTREITNWDSITMYIKCLPVQQQRRMAVVDDTLYCTFELEGLVSAVDAATGKALKVYKDTNPTQEIAFDDGILFLNVGERFPSAAYNIVKTKGRPFVEGKDPSQPFHGSGFREGYDPEIQDKENPVSVIMAVDPKSGKTLWKTDPLNNYTAATLSIKNGRAVYQTSEGIFCVDARTGKSLWANKKPIINALGHDSGTPGTLPNTMVITDDKVFSVEQKDDKLQKASVPKYTLRTYSVEDGKLLWEAPVAGNYEASADIFVVNGSLWVGGGAAPTQYNMETGAAIKTVKQKMNGPMGHDRCYRNMITERHYINSKTGGADFINLETGEELPNHWTRGGCGMGVLPANGLLYSTPYSCVCSVGSMFQGMNAFAGVPGLTKSNDPVPVSRTVRLEKGPAYGKVRNGVSATADDWPVYRGDSARSGIATSKASSRLKAKWRSQLSTRGSALTSAAGKVFVADIDTHTLYGLDTGSGDTLWQFTADGRIDSPPSYYKGMVFFGSRDGWLYCLRATDGELVYRFKDLPDRLICAFSQLESAWPVSGSVLALDDRIYFAAGHSTFLDGGMFLYCLDPASGKILNSRAVYGPFNETTGFPVAAKGADPQAGFKNGILVSRGDGIHLRQKSFAKDLSDTSTAETHILPITGFLDSQPQHRTGWMLASSVRWWQSGVKDILVSDGTDAYEVEGFPVYHNHSYFDPRRSGYKLIASTTGAPQVEEAASPKRGGKSKKKTPKKRGLQRSEKWRVNIPITGKAIGLAGDVLFVAGEPMTFKGDVSHKTYADAYAGKLGGRLLAVSAKDGKTLAEHKLDAAPAWDGIAIAGGQVFVSLADGSVQCFGE